MSSGLTWQDMKYMLTEKQYNDRVEYAKKMLPEENAKRFIEYLNENYFVIGIKYEK